MKKRKPIVVKIDKEITLWDEIVYVFILSILIWAAATPFFYLPMIFSKEVGVQSILMSPLVFPAVFIPALLFKLFYYCRGVIRRWLAKPPKVSILPPEEGEQGRKRIAEEFNIFDFDARKGRK